MSTRVELIDMVGMLCVMVCAALKGVTEEKDKMVGLWEGGKGGRIC